MWKGVEKRVWVGMLGVVVLAGISACDDSPTEPKDPPIDMVEQAADLRGRAQQCDSLKVPAGNRLVSTFFARGDQVYRWDGTAWVFVEPVAKLYVNRHTRWVAGTHYAGPTWESRRGSKVKGSVVKRCTASSTSIPWLLLSGNSDDKRGTFSNVTYIQRVNTVGGIAPAQAGTSVGEVRHVPYTADYRFYRAK